MFDLTPEQITAARIERALTDLGWNQSDLAREIGKTGATVSLYLSGKRSIPLAARIVIANVLAQARSRREQDEKALAVGRRVLEVVREVAS